MGSHRARHGADRHPSEELATDLLARLAAEARPSTARRRETAPMSLDPFATAPFPARPPQPTATSRPASTPPPGSPRLPLSATGATRCGGTTPHRLLLHERLHGRDTAVLGAAGTAPRTGNPHIDGSRIDGPDTDGSDTVSVLDAPEVEYRTAGSAAASLDMGRSAAAYAVIAGLDGPVLPPVTRFSITSTSGGRGPRRRPLYAAVSATVITATAAVAASAGPTAFTPASAAPDLTARSAALASGAAADFALPGGPTATTRSPDPTTAPQAPVQGATIAAQATADAKTQAQRSAAAPTSAPAATAPTSAPAATATSRASAPPTTTPRATSPQVTTPAAAPPRSTAPKPAPAPARATTPAPAKPAPAPAARPAPAKPAAPAAASGSNVGSRALSVARGKLGAPYVYGSSGPSAFDCSGLVVWAYRQLGVALPHSSRTLSTMGVPVAQSALQPGDLVFFYSPVSHVGIYAGNGMVLNATQSGQPVQFTKLAHLPFHNARRITG